MKGTCGHTTTYSCLVFQIFPMSWENVWQLQSQRRKEPKELFARNMKPHKASVVPWVRFQPPMTSASVLHKNVSFYSIVQLYICRLKKKVSTVALLQVLLLTLWSGEGGQSELRATVRVLPSNHGFCNAVPRGCALAVGAPTSVTVCSEWTKWP